MLANLVCRRLDRRLDGLARKLNLTYTRYADDLTFSGGPENRTLLGWLLARIRHIADEEGFSLNPDKTRIMRAGSAQSVTGLIVNDKASIDSKLLRRVRAILHQAAKNGLEAQNRDGLPNFAEWLAGMNKSRPTRISPRSSTPYWPTSSRS